MSNQNSHLVKGRHVVCVDPNGDLVIVDGNVTVHDLQDNCLYAVPLNNEICEFFELPCQEPERAGADMSPVTVAPPMKQLKKRPQGSKPKESTTEVAQWDLAQEEALIKIWKKRQSDFGQSKTNLEVWRDIRDDLLKEGFAYEVVQVQNKWKNLRKNYIGYIDNGGPNNSGGEPIKKPKHFDELEEIFRKTLHVTPVIASSKRQYPLQSENLSDEEVESENSPSQLCQTPKIRKFQTKLQKELSSWAESMKVESQKKDEVKSERYTAMRATYSQMADAEQRAATCLENLTHFLMNREKQNLMIK